MHGATKATAELKVVNFNSAQRLNPIPVKISGLLRAQAITWLDGQLQRLFLIIDDELFKRSDRAESTAAQGLYFESMRQMRLEAAGVQSCFLARVLADFDAFWEANELSSIEALADRTGRPEAENGFALLDNETLELELAITNLAEKGNAIYQNELFALNQRLASLKDLSDINNNQNPISPIALASAIDSAFRTVEVDFQVKLLFYKLFESTVIGALGPLYQDLNRMLQVEGILPNLTRSFRRSGDSDRSRSQSGDVGLEASSRDEDENTQQVTELFENLQTMLDGWRLQMGLAPSVNIATSSAPSYEALEVLGVLNRLQLPNTEGPPAAADGIKAYVTEQLNQLSGSESKPLSRTDEDTMDMVAIIFDFILGDPNLPDPIKALIGRLQIPIVKVAILEKSFFARKTHPARLLLNALAQAGLGLDPSEAVAENAIFANIQMVVERVLNEFEQDIGVFASLLEEFGKLIEKEVQRSKMTEERTRQVTQSKEQLQLVKRKVAYEIATRLQGRNTPAPVRFFLYNVWKDVMILACLRRDKTEGEWDRAVVVVEKLVWSVTVPVDASNRKEIVQAIPPLLKAIRAGLEAIALDPAGVVGTLKDLESCHVARLSQPASQVQSTGVTVGSVVEEPAAEMTAVEIRDPELAQAILEIGANLPDVEAFTVEDLSKPVNGLRNRVSSTDSPFMPQALSLEVGEWVEFQDGKRRMRAKLSWRSQVTSTCVFVNRRGVKVMEIGVSDLAERFGDGTARIIEGGGVPLMDRALNALMGTLKGSAENRCRPCEVTKARALFDLSAPGSQ